MFAIGPIEQHRQQEVIRIGLLRSSRESASPRSPGGLHMIRVPATAPADVVLRTKDSQNGYSLFLIPLGVQVSTMRPYWRAPSASRSVVPQRIRAAADIGQAVTHRSSLPMRFGARHNSSTVESAPSSPVLGSGSRWYRPKSRGSELRESGCRTGIDSNFESPSAYRRFTSSRYGPSIHTKAK
jgi:hypothetical protein